MILTFCQPQELQLRLTWQNNFAMSKFNMDSRDRTLALLEFGPKFSFQAVTLSFSYGVNPSPKLQVRYNCSLPVKLDYKIFKNVHMVDYKSYKCIIPIRWSIFIIVAVGDSWAEDSWNNGCCNTCSVLVVIWHFLFRLFSDMFLCC